MLNKLQLWNYVALLSSQCQYQNQYSKTKLATFYMNVLDYIWYNKLSTEDVDWLNHHIFDTQDAWIDPVSAASGIIKLIQQIDKSVVVYESMSEQLIFKF